MEVVISKMWVCDEEAVEERGEEGGGKEFSEMQHVGVMCSDGRMHP